jgi:hypothetical protein
VAGCIAEADLSTEQVALLKACDFVHFSDVYFWDNNKGAPVGLLFGFQGFSKAYEGEDTTLKSFNDLDVDEGTRALLLHYIEAYLKNELK